MQPVRPGMDSTTSTPTRRDRGHGEAPTLFLFFFIPHSTLSPFPRIGLCLQVLVMLAVHQPPLSPRASYGLDGACVCAAGGGRAHRMRVRGGRRRW
jgi:hypothetical protein